MVVSVETAASGINYSKKSSSKPEPLSDSSANKHTKLSEIFHSENGLESFLQIGLAGCSDQCNDRIAVLKTPSPALAAVLSVLEQLLLVMNHYPSRPLLSLTLCEALQSALHHKAVRGCYELLKAKDDFVLLRALAPPLTGSSNSSGNHSGDKYARSTAESGAGKSDKAREATLSFFDEFEDEEEEEQRHQQRANSGRNKLLNIVNKPDQVAARLKESGWEVINRSGGQASSMRPPLSAPRFHATPAESDWQAQLRELKQQKAEAHVKTATASSADSSTPASVAVKSVRRALRSLDGASIMLQGESDVATDVDDQSADTSGQNSTHEHRTPPRSLRNEQTYAKTTRRRIATISSVENTTIDSMKLSYSECCYVNEVGLNSRQRSSVILCTSLNC